MSKMPSLFTSVTVSAALHGLLLLGLTLLLDSYQNISTVPMTVSLMPSVVAERNEVKLNTQRPIATQALNNSREISEPKPTSQPSHALPSSISAALVVPIAPVAIVENVQSAIAPLAAAHTVQTAVPAAPHVAATFATAVMSPVNNPTNTLAAQDVTTEQPISHAAYLNNPPPQYPAQSRRLGERGTVRWRVLIGTDGKATEPELVQSSGFARLDEAAKQALLAWRYVPGKRGGVVQAMRYVVPLSFE